MLPGRKHNSSREQGRNLSAQLRPRPLTLDASPVKGSTEKFLCVLHFIDSRSSRFSQRWLWPLAAARRAFAIRDKPNTSAELTADPPPAARRPATLPIGTGITVA